MMSILEGLGFTTHNVMACKGDFWSTPAGLFITGLMFICSCVNIWYKGIDDNLFDRVFYSAMALTTLCAFLLGLDPSQHPHNIMQTLLYLFCVRLVASVFVNIYQHRKTGTPQKTKCQ